MRVLYRFSVLQNNPILSSLKQKLLEERKSIILLLGISLISSSIVVIQPLLMQKLIDEAFIPKDIESLYFWASLIILIGVIGIAISSFTQYSYTSLSTKLLFNFRSDIFGKIFHHKKIFFQNYKTGDLLSRLEGDISTIQRFGTDSIFSLTTAFFGLVGAIYIMYSFDPILCFFSLCLLPIEFFILKPLYPKMSDKTRNLRESTAQMGSFIIESLRYVLFFKTFNAITKRVENLNEFQDDNKTKILSQQKLQIVFSQVPVIISLLGRIIIVFWGGTRVIEGEMLLGEFIAFLTYFGMILGPIQTLLGFLNSFPKIKVSLERLEVLLPKVEEKILHKKLYKKTSVHFENVSFAYTPNLNIFKNLNLYIPYGEKIYLLGENGTGKSTLLDILLNLTDIDEGKVKISGIDINKIHPKVLYKTIARVEQHPIILADTIRSNLKLVKQDSRTEELIDVLEKVDLLKWVNSLEKGLDTNLSENGESLSGGQRQRLSIARILLLKPSIILLDEHTSSLDKEASKKIELLIDELFSKQTRIIISHRNHNVNEKSYTLINKKVVSNFENKYYQ